MQQIRFSVFENRFAKRPETITVPLDVFAKRMIEPVSYNATDKNKLPLWSPAVFDGNRAQANVIEVSCLVYDIDDGIAPFSSWQLFAQYKCIVHTSFSHKPHHHKYRVIMPLKKPVLVRDWQQFWRAAAELWQKMTYREPDTDTIDIWTKTGLDKSKHPEAYSRIVGRGIPDMKALKDCARMFYRYAIPHSNEYRAGHPLDPVQYHNSWYHLVGDCIDLEYSHIELPKPPPRPVYDTSKPISMGDALMMPEMRLALAHRANADISGNVARHIICPGCNRATVHFYIDPHVHHNPQRFAKCNHANSCGWYGSLEAL